MKVCKHCQAENTDDMKFCTACGEPLDAEESEATQAEEAAQTVEVPQAEEAAQMQDTPQEDEDGFEVIPPVEEKPQAKKSYGGMIAVGVLAVLLVVAVIFGKAQYDKQKKQPADDQLQVPGETPSEDSQDDETIDVTELPGHHVNAYGLNSHSIHYTVNDDGSYTYDFLNENGETVSVSSDELEGLLDQTVATAGDMTLTNRELMYYYDEQYYSFYSQYSVYISYIMDMSMPLDEQVSFDGVNSWEQSFVDAGINMFHQTAAICAEAKAQGFELSEELQENAATAASSLNDMALQYGYAGAEDYLQAYYGPAVTLDSYMEFFNLSQYANAYLTSLQDAMDITDEEIEAYYDENADTMQNTYGIQNIDQPNVNVRHILITPESTTDDEGNTVTTDESWAAAEAKAQEIYDEWKAGRATEDTFGELAQANTDDSGSLTNGGLYEDVYPGQMVTEFNDWCFDSSRQPGDTGIVKTSYGYHIMYFVGTTDEIYWRTAVKSLITSENISDEIANLQLAYPLTSDYSKAILLSSQAPTLPSTDTDNTEDTTSSTGTTADGE